METETTGGGPPGYFPPDESLDRVAALLGTTGEGLTEMFGGDAEPQIIGVVNDESDIVPDNSITPTLLVDNPLPVAIENESVSTDYISMVTESPTTMGNGVPANDIGEQLKLGSTNTRSISTAQLQLC